MKVSVKFTLALIAGIVLVHGVSAAVRVRREMKLLEEDSSSDERVLGRMLANAVERTWASRGAQDALDIVQHTTHHAPHLAIRLVRLDVPPDDPSAPIAPVEMIEPLPAGASYVFRVGHGHGTLYTYVRVSSPTGRPGAIEIADPLVDERAYMTHSIYNAALAALVLVVLCATLAWALGIGFIARPVRLLVEQARRIGAGDLSQRLSLQTRDEIGELGREMDAMCDRLEQARDQVDAEICARLDAIEQLRHADRLTTVGTLASGVAHELGTPINVIAGHAQLIREDRAASEIVVEHVGVISGQCARMTRIIRELLDFARRRSPVGASADVAEVARDTLRMVEPLARPRAVTTVLGAVVEARAVIDAGQLQQVLTNIVVNGIHAMPDGGALTLRVSRERLAPPGTGSPPAAYVCASVEDVGIGMDADTRRRAFEPFFTTKDVGEGTGLGLAVAYGIVRDHGGWIDVTSAPGRGSRFAVYLPAEHA